jgi:hypothetical protein
MVFVILIQIMAYGIHVKQPIFRYMLSHRKINGTWRMVGSSDDYHCPYSSFIGLHRFQCGHVKPPEWTP